MVAHPRILSFNHSIRTLSSNFMYKSELDAASGPSTATAGSLTVHSSESWHHKNARRESTGNRIENAVASCLNHASALAPELLSIGIEIADYGYVPGLSGIARRLLEIWRAIEQVRVNRDDALRLAGRCADVLNCLKADVNRNGERVPTALELPIQRLEDTLDIIHHCMEKHIRRALIVQYLRKNSISRDISYCGSLLDDAMILISFGLGLIFQQSLIDNRNTLRFRDAVDRGNQSPIIT